MVRRTAPDHGTPSPEWGAITAATSVAVPLDITEARPPGKKHGCKQRNRGTRAWTAPAFSKKGRMMDRRQAVIDALEFRRPAHVPWSIHAPASLVEQAREQLGLPAGADVCGDHVGIVSSGLGRLDPIGGTLARDPYGVTWERGPEHGMGMPVEHPLREADLDTIDWPDPTDHAWYGGLDEKLHDAGDRFTLFLVRFSLFERAWLLRGMENLMIDMFERPDFVEALLDAICEQNLAQIDRAAALGVDAVHFCDDYGAQTGMLIGLPMWRRFIRPRLARQYDAVRAAGLYVSHHSCGNVTELLDDFVEIGLNLLNPLQPEVMDAPGLLRRYRGKLAFFGGLSDQQTLPHGGPDAVAAETRALLEAGRDGGYVFAPAGSIGADVPLENFLAMLRVLRDQEMA